ncbi:polysaccharide deacetylase family protein [Pseudoalteromonas sp. T1lg65]|uniref:polysaccharide deacetylase family protein n=1 Tax=Pseudoalteromonas sp. T1lg65 TaxID=2077101 RepID=UPI003F791CA4
MMSKFRKVTVLFLFTLCSAALGTQAKEIAITFDDAPLAGSAVMSGKEKTAKIIEGLQSQQVSDALFFVTTGNIRDDEEVARLQAYTKAGYHLGNHSHQHRSLNKLDVQSYLLDFYQSHLVLQSYDNVLKFHRFPYLHYGKTKEKRAFVLNRFNELGYKIGYVTVDNFDWYINGRLQAAANAGKKIDFKKLKTVYIDTIWEAIRFYDQLAERHLGKPVKHVLLLHENELAALFIGDLVAHIKSQGWKIISPVEAYSDTTLSSYSPEFNFNGQGRIAALLHANGVYVKLLRHRMESTDAIDLKLKQAQVFSE